MTIGELHTFSNYFTVALVLLGIVFEMTGRMKHNDGAMRYGWTSLRLGFLFVLLSLVTGFAAEAGAHAAPEAATTAMFHKTVAIVFAGFVFLLVLFRMVFSKKIASAESGAMARGAYLTLQIVTIVLILVTMFLGTRLVNIYGVGVRPVEKMNQLPPTPPAAPPGIQQDTTQYLR